MAQSLDPPVCVASRSSIQQQLLAQLCLVRQQFLEHVTEGSVHRLGPGHGDQQVQGLLLSLSSGEVTCLQVQLRKLLSCQLIWLEQKLKAGICDHLYLQHPRRHESTSISM